MMAEGPQIFDRALIRRRHRRAAVLGPATFLLDRVADIDQRIRGVGEALSADLIARGDDLISRLIAADSDEGRLSEDELISTCILVLNAGHEATTRNPAIRGHLGAPNAASLRGVLPT